MFSRFDGAEVEDVMPDRLLQLVGIVIREKHPGHVGFYRLDFENALRIAGWIAQECEFLLQRDIGAGLGNDVRLEHATP
jgi:hypothetical protein